MLLPAPCRADLGMNPLFVFIPSQQHPRTLLYSPGDCPQLFNLIINRLGATWQWGLAGPELAWSLSFSRIPNQLHILGFHQTMDSGQDEKKSFFSHPFKLSFFAACEFLVTAESVQLALQRSSREELLKCPFLPPLG